MRKETEYRSSIGHHIEGFLAEKQSLGYKYIHEANILRIFDEYWATHNYCDTGLTPDNLEDWVQMGENEGPARLIERISVIRQFSLYLNGLCIPSYIPPIETKYEVPVRIPLAKYELKEFFSEVDDYSPAMYGGSVFSKRMSKEYPVLFRMIYLNGMRVSEAISLPLSLVDLESGIVTILDGKGNKNRLIYMEEDMTMLCRDYLKWLRSELGTEPAWVFPGRDPERHIHISSVDYRFNRFWEKTPSSAIRAVKPTVHDLRHTFVVDRINLWLEQGLDFNQMLPYLSKFLGHRSFDETFYYYHYAQEAAKTIRKMDTVIGKVIPEVMRR